LAPSYSGLHVFKYKNGRIWSEVIFKNGFAWDVLSNYDKNGVPQDKGTLKNGSGSRNIYDENGKLLFVNHYRNGELIQVEERQ
jgi:antitoxin component YwqK of YwqJK toxin-antitoxin module